MRFAALFVLVALCGCGVEETPHTARSPDQVTGEAPYVEPPFEQVAEEVVDATPAEAVVAPGPSARDVRDIRICVHLMRRHSVDAVINDEGDWFADIETLRQRLPPAERDRPLGVGENHFSWESPPPRRSDEPARAQACRERLLRRAAR